MDSFSQITYGTVGGRPTVSISSPVTGNDLRAFIVATPAAGSVTNNDIEFIADLRINGSGALVDNNAVYHFPGQHRYAPQAGCTVTFTDVMIHYSGTTQKVHSFNGAYTANFTRVFYLQGVTTGRSDFFNNGAYTFNMSDVIFVSYGASDFLHFQTDQTLNNITIVNASGGLNFEPGARLNGQVEVINNLKLVGITRIVGGSGAQGDFKAYDMDWNATNWNFSQRNVDFFFVNPIKPAGWTGYSGSASRVKEYYTHDVTVIDEALAPLPNINVLLYNYNDDVFDYNLTTDAQGQINTQEILKIDNAVALNHDRGFSAFVIAEYLKEYVAIQRNFDTAITDNVISKDDEYITETNAVTVGGYSGIAINHATKTLTISQNHTLCEVYDYIKLNKMSNLTSPSIDNLFISVAGETLDIDDYQFILSGSAVITPCDKFAKIESTVLSSIADVDNLEIGLEDSGGLYKLLSFTNVVSADVVLTDENTSTTLRTETNFTGTINFVTQLNSTQIRMLITRDGYTSWSANIDVSGSQEIFRFEVYQTLTDNPATIENQDEIIFLAKKILIKNEGILKSLNGTNPTLNINNITQPATINATEERQEEILSLLKRVLSKTTAIRKSM